VKEVNFPEAMAWGEIRRYIREATQPMSYFIGKHEILKLRDAYRKKLKEKYNLADFHKKFLECGVMPVKLAEQQILS